MSGLMLAALRGESTPRRPLWIMRQAGRYLPEYRALRKEHSFEQLADSAELSAEVTLQPFARYPLDAAIIFADLMSPIPALGVPVRFDPGPVIDRRIGSAADIAALREPDPAEVAPQVAEALRRVKPELPDGVALLGFAGAPMSIAAYMVEGSGKKGFPALRALAAEDEVAFGTLMDKLARLCADYLVGQVRAGADAVQVFDSWGGLLSLADWNRLVRPHLQQLLEAIGNAGVPRILYVQDGHHLLDGLIDLPSEALALDWRVDLPALRRRGVEKALQGNLDPAVLLAGPQATRSAAQSLLQAMPAQGHIFNLGQGILPGTSLESVQALIDAVHDEPRG